MPWYLWVTASFIHTYGVPALSVPTAAKCEYHKGKDTAVSHLWSTTCRLSFILAEKQIFIIYVSPSTVFSSFSIDYLHLLNESSVDERWLLLDCSSAVFPSLYLIALLNTTLSWLCSFGPLFMPFLSMMIFLKGLITTLINSRQLDFSFLNLSVLSIEMDFFSFKDFSPVCLSHIGPWQNWELLYLQDCKLILFFDYSLYASICSMTHSFRNSYQTLCYP